MSSYALVHFPQIDTSKIDAIRDVYDPYRKLIGVHITIIFPVQVEREDLVRHVNGILTGWSPFNIRLRGFCLSFDRWLFLTVEQGNDKLVSLFEAMYTGLLAPHRRHDIEFIPHIGLGYFGTQPYDPGNPTVVPLDEARYLQVKATAEAQKLDYQTRVDRLSMVEIDDQFTRTEVLQEFVL
jgi:2'-5' RNA ligase